MEFPSKASKFSWNLWKCKKKRKKNKNFQYKCKLIKKKILKFSSRTIKNDINTFFPSFVYVANLVYVSQEEESRKKFADYLKNAKKVIFWILGSLKYANSSKYVKMSFSKVWPKTILTLQYMCKRNQERERKMS